MCRLNIEVRRLSTWLKDEYWYLKECRDCAKPLIANEIDMIIEHHVKMGGVQQNRLAQIVTLPGYSGRVLDGGCHKGCMGGSSPSPPFSNDPEDVEHREAELRPGLPEDNEQLADDIGRLDDYVHGID